MLRIILITFLIISTSRVIAFPYLVINESVNSNSQTVMYEKMSLEYWLKVFLTVFLVLLGGLFSGLTIGLMSLDETNLHILTQSGDPKKRYVRACPIRKNGHLLLVTLLLCNVLVNETLPIVMDDVMGSGSISAILASSALIVLFGEILPQAICTRYGLAIGAFFAWPTRILIWLTFVFSYPIAKLLDFVLGESHGVVYRRAELKELIKYHETSNEHGGDLNTDSVTIIRGALDLQDKVAESAITPLNKIFMINVNTILDRNTMHEIFLSGYSRIPVYEGSRNNIKGVLLVKSMILYNPDEALPLKKFNINPIITVEASTSLLDILNSFQEGKCHMAVVVKESNLLGFITLEDVLEELIQEEIYDESDTMSKKISGLNASINAIRNNKFKKIMKRASNFPDNNDPKDLIAFE
ncbi:16756_t:CDS:2 [Racocetra persica]|uniref:16756_t:CDS:1 n=1 Tax=Racocetra persica TaxID=160502 RepID=A0ACA9QFY7_9GLOM|nr:16756_t:CDS:2 [Racocetra persica]